MSADSRTVDSHRHLVLAAQFDDRGTDSETYPMR